MDKNVQKGFEFEGTDVETAIPTALEKLGTTRDNLVIKVVCEEKKGLFGMEGAKPAKIKVFYKQDDNKA